VRKVENPPNRFESAHIAWDDGEAPDAGLRIHEETAKSILAENESPDLPFRWSVNPYRGCFHACIYCYARPSHQYLGWGAGSDFERELVVKTNAPELLCATFDRPGWKGELITFSGNTDCYQPLEARYGLTRACLEVCARYRNPITIVTKNALVARDVDVLQALSRGASVRVFLSIPFSDDATGRAVEPGASPVSRRFEAMAALSAAGIETGVAMAPMIAGLNDRMIGPVLRRAREAGARHAFTIALRLPAEVGPVFEERLRANLSEKADKVLRAVRETRGGKINESRFGARMRGEGPRWQAIEDLFDLEAHRLGMNTERIPERPPTFRRPTRQLTLLE
jgi:DNA repair photolyase